MNAHTCAHTCTCLRDYLWLLRLSLVGERGPQGHTEALHGPFMALHSDAGFSRVGRRLGVRLPSWAGRRLQRRPAASAVSDRAAPAPATGESRCRSTFLPAVGALKVIVGFSPTENSGKHPAQPWCPVKSMMWLL
ncbi:hypothetical protein HJG60_008817 [Phyllostomus discolor]|uniref:Uncharacterized protein n=1 Tax=Phyllostomus discolor TaxID=89673 RepID=A0A833YZ23_9CHIR|nr:hypothetical protein HJG60_008817 [Phyllostomus discolor]